MTRNARRIAAIAPVVLLLAVLLSAVTAANTVPATHLVDNARPVGANDLKPSQCAGLTLTELRTGNGNINGNGQDELILGSSGANTITGGGGDDCILGGGGDDSINGGGGTDVCIGGPGTDTLSSNCETSIQ